MNSGTSSAKETMFPDQNILILGASGMLGSALFTSLPQISTSYKTFGTVRGSSAVPICGDRMELIRLKDVFDRGALLHILETHKIDVVINAIGLIKQLGGTPKAAFVKTNAWLPHALMELCDEVGARFIEISTDCVFTGDKGNYSEDDRPDARDIYGLTKLMGEVTDNPKALTIRTSIIGHESGRAASLVDWFLSQSGTVGGYNKAIFSGFPTAYLADIIGRYVLPNSQLYGLYHVSANPIDKFSLLSLVAQAYQHDVELVPNDKLIIDRSLDSTRFRDETGFVPPDWPDLINIMKSDRPVWKRYEH
ncbi:MAG: SDR family oxidoreductase [Hellea sp.]